MAESEQKKKKLQMWIERYTRAENAYRSTLDLMDARERAYEGEVEFSELVKNESAKAEDIKHIRNVIGELIEAQVDTTICQPKVTALHREDAALAKLTEDALKNELERLRIKQIYDQTERITPIQGGVLYLVEWDTAARTHTTEGEIKLQYLHPKEVIPQDGILTGISDMDYIFVKLPRTKDMLRSLYNVEFDDEDVSEAEPDLRSARGAEAAEDLVTQVQAYFKAENGAIGLFSWILEHDVILCDYEDYQARRELRCSSCGGTHTVTDDEGRQVCAGCGSTGLVSESSEYEVITEPFTTADGEEIEASPLSPVNVRWYKPNVYPVVLQKNVSRYGRFLGASDVDMIYSQQQTINRIGKAITDKLLSGGTVTTLPSGTQISEKNGCGRVVYVKDPAEIAMISVRDLTCDIANDLNYAENVHEQMKEMIGITDAFLGRKDATATSAVAKEFSANRSAGRLESKREMKNAAWSELFEIMFKFKLAYTDEARSVRSVSDDGQAVYDEFDRHRFIRRDAAGELYYDTEFLFSVDASASLASNREAMWQETRMNLTQGAFGDPTSLETLILFWTKMELLHYPGAAETKRVLESKLQEAKQAQAMEASRAQEEAALEAERVQADAAREAQMSERAEMESRLEKEQAELMRIDEIARRDAERDVQAMVSARQAQAQTQNAVPMAAMR